MALLNWPDFLERLDQNKVLALELAQDLLKAQQMRLQRLEDALSAQDFKAVEQSSHAFRGLLAPYGPTPILLDLKKIEEAARSKSLVDWQLPDHLRSLLSGFAGEVEQEIAKLEEEFKKFDV